jgi:triosephosphate isomerase
MLIFFKAYEDHENSNIKFIAQNMHYAETDIWEEISAAMLKEMCGVNTVIFRGCERPLLVF